MPLEARQENSIETQSVKDAVAPREVAIVPVSRDATSGVPPFDTPELNRYGRRAGEVLGSTTKSIERLLEGARTRTLNMYEEACQRAQAFGAHARNRILRMKREDTFRFLGIIAGSAFLVGVALRIGRSRRS